MRNILCIVSTRAKHSSCKLPQTMPPPTRVAYPSPHLHGQTRSVQGPLHANIPHNERRVVAHTDVALHKHNNLLRKPKQLALRKRTQTPRSVSTKSWRTERRLQWYRTTPISHRVISRPPESDSALRRLSACSTRTPSICSGDWSAIWPAR